MRTSSEIDQLVKEEEMIYDRDGSWRSYYQDIANFCIPRQAWKTSIRVMGERLKDNYLYDVRAIRAMKESVCGFHANLTNPSSRWFQTSMLDEKLMQSGAVQKALKKQDDVMFDVINDSNFDNAMLEDYVSSIGFGTSNMLVEEDEVDQVRYKELPVEQYSIVEDDRGRVFKCYVRMLWTSNQCYTKWGNDCPKEIKDDILEGGMKTHDIIFYVGPRDKRDPYKIDKKNKPWETFWIIKKPQTMMEEGGYEEFPFAIGRFWHDNNNDPRGFSPAMDALASIKLLNAEKRTFIRHAMKASDPAWMAPYKAFLSNPNFNPSAANYYDAKKFKPDAFRFLNPEGNSNLNIEAMEMEGIEIDRAFFVDVFRAISNVTMDKKKRSIPEVQRVVAEGMSMLGPIVGKKIEGTLDPLLERTRAICERRRLFEVPPESLWGKDTKILFNSPLARAQKQSQMMGLSSYLQVMGELAQFNQTVLDPINFDKVSKIIADIQGVDPSIYYDDQKVQKIRADRAKMQKQQQMAAMAEQATSAAKNAGQAHKAVKEAQQVE